MLVIGSIILLIRGMKVRNRTCDKPETKPKPFAGFQDGPSECREKKPTRFIEGGKDG